jgi:hypothetical protein
MVRSQSRPDVAVSVVRPGSRVGARRSGWHRPDSLGSAERIAPVPKGWAMSMLGETLNEVIRGPDPEWTRT